MRVISARSISPESTGSCAQEPSPRGYDQDEYQRGTLAIVVPRRENRGKGYGAEAIRLLLGYAFDRINLNKVELEVYEYNERAYRLYLRLGFVEEGRRRARVYRNGRYYESIQMGILRDEFYAVNSTDHSAGNTK